VTNLYIIASPYFTVNVDGPTLKHGITVLKLLSGANLSSLLHADAAAMVPYGCNAPLPIAGKTVTKLGSS
jgi:hypothetical protein